MLPFFLFYSMFGFQRVGDLIWAAGDIRARGFLIGGTSGRTTLPGEGLQHQDGNSHALAMTVPNVRAYDPTYAYELATIIRYGIREMYEENQDLIYYITVMNDKYPMPPMPEDADDGILRGLYRVKEGQKKIQLHLAGSGALLPEALRAAELLGNEFDVDADVFSATSWKALYDDAIRTDRDNRLHPGKKEKQPYVTEQFSDGLPVVAATDYIRSVPLSVASWVPGGMTALGTDGFGQSDNRKALRAHFEVNAENIALAGLHALWRRGEIDKKVVTSAIKKLKINPEAQFAADV